MRKHSMTALVGILFGFAAVTHAGAVNAAESVSSPASKSVRGTRMPAARTKAERPASMDPLPVRSAAPLTSKQPSPYRKLARPAGSGASHGPAIPPRPGGTVTPPAGSGAPPFQINGDFGLTVTPPNSGSGSSSPPFQIGGDSGLTVTLPNSGGGSVSPPVSIDPGTGLTVEIPNGGLSVTPPSSRPGRVPFNPNTRKSTAPQTK